MRALEEFFESEVDRTLYHYTGIGGLLGIVNSKNVWASHAYYLNDSREILHACDVLKSLLSDRVKRHSKEEQEFLGQLKVWLSTFENTPYHIYIFSLSEERSLLSQWRSYTPHGKGVSLGFSPSTIRSMLQSSGSRVARCRYESGEHQELLEALVDKLLDTYNQVRDVEQGVPHAEGEKYFSFLETYRGDFLQVLSVIKHSSFKEECEWRVISPYYNNYTVPEIKFREGASMILPYIEIAIGDDKRKAVFDEVVLGPSRDNNLSHFALAHFLSKEKASEQTVSCGIPFRKW